MPEQTRNQKLHKRERSHMKIITICSTQPRTLPLFPFFKVSRHPAPSPSTSTLSPTLSDTTSRPPTIQNQSYICRSYLLGFYGCRLSFRFPSPRSTSLGWLSGASSLHTLLLSHPSNSWITQRTFAFGLACLILGKFELSLVLYSTHHISHLHGAWKEGLGHLCSSTWFWLGLLCFAYRCMERRMRRWITPRRED
ncbi:hypothetical protein BKA65DRAFT_144701 [Rhexocercosporidium sp. MPI-PUGE-AT-0058]|nr:hypothetical protein BKA65DRAFT_144701 [Rhexocercosporidium sp. MPI-PUGE-AT-0058]